jgi:glucose/mannose-6-phosphate isomerase
VIDLDDETAVRAADPGGMLAAVVALPEHCRDGYRLGTAIAPVPSVRDVTAVAFCGMGGSAISGDAIRALYADRLPVPMTTVRDSRLPAFCGSHTLVLISSYSGDTAEALACFNEAMSRGCRVVLVTSGGELGSRADARAIPCVEIPGGLVPRAAFGYLLFGWLGVLEAVGLLPPAGADVDQSIGELRATIATLVPSVPTPVNPSKKLALAVEERAPVVWGAEGIGAVAAMRWKTQFNENAKVPAWASSLPELDHNEVVGWSAGTGSRYFLVILRHEGEWPDVATRVPLSIEIGRDAGTDIEEVWAAGSSPLARLLSLVAIGDFTATYLGLRRGADPSEMDAIARLKRALAEA